MKLEGTKILIHENLGPKRRGEKIILPSPSELDPIKEKDFSSILWRN